MSAIPRHSLPDDHSNLHLLAIHQNYRSYRRSSEGTVTNICNLRVPPLTSRIMEEQGPSRSQYNSTSPCGTLEHRLSSTLTRNMLTSQSFTPRSGSSSISDESECSIDSCSALVTAIEALKSELQEYEKGIDDQDQESADIKTDSGQNTQTKDDDSFVMVEAGVKDNQSPVNSTSVESYKKISDVAKKEKILNECKNQIKTLTAANKTLEKNMLETKNKLALAMAYKIPCRKNLKCWPRTRGCVQDLEKKLTLDDDYVEPSEIIAVLLESERRYVTALTLLNSHYQQPMRMLSSFSPETLSMQQLNTLFLNCTELLVLHRVFYEALLQIPSLPESVQVDKLFEVLEGTFSAFGHYNSFLTRNRQQNVQRELRQLKGKPQFEQLMKHCEQNCEGITLQTLLDMPAERIPKYSEILAKFLNPRVRALPEDTTKRAEALIRFLRNLGYNLIEEKSEWDYTQEKIKFLNKLTSDCPIPLEIFNSEVRLVKQGPLTQVVGKKESAKQCILFNNHIALAQTKDTHCVIENGMLSLYGAQLHKCVDVEGQVIGSDLQSGLSEDKLAFKLSFVNNKSLYLRAARPNEWKQWVEMLEKCIEETQMLQLELEMDLDHSPLYPVDAGPKIAAASLEKLFQQLTSPHFDLHQDFMRVFLLTHSCFTTARDVLTALLNCIKSPDDRVDSISQVSENDLFVFEELSVSGSACVSASPSLYTINTDSETGSPGPSPSIVRRPPSSTYNSTISSSPSPNSLLRAGSSDRKAVHSGASFASTDSDVSPHTSAIVVDNVPVSTRNGWAEGVGDPELNSRNKFEDKHPFNCPPSPSTSPGDSEHYSKLYPLNQVCIPDSEASDVEVDDGGETPQQQTSTSNSMENIGSRYNPATGRRRSESETDSRELQTLICDEEDTLKETLDGIHHSERMHLELDEASKMMEQLTVSLDAEFSQQDTGDVFLAEDNVNNSVPVERRKRIPSKALKRLGIISTTLSSSEPELNMLGINIDAPPPLPPRDPDMLSPKYDETRSLSSPFMPKNLVRQGSEHCLLSSSINLGSISNISDKYSITSGIFGRDKKPKNEEKSSSKGKRKKKSDTYSGRATPTGPSNGSPSKSSSMYFGNSPSHSRASGFSSSFNQSDLDKNSKKSKWFIIRKVGKKLSRSPSIDPDEVKKNIPQRSQSIPSVKKCGLYPGRSTSLSTEEPDGLTGLVSPRHRRRTSSLQVNSVNLVSKIFSVLSCWVNDYFEDFVSDEELIQSLREFLETLITKTTYESLEYHTSHQLLDLLQRKRQFVSIPPANCPFRMLLNRVIHVKPFVLDMYDWENPDKLMKGRELDFGKKESLCLKVIAEQLTLMEFSVYNIIQRRELLNCNWKKQDKEKLSPNICRLIRRTNDMTSWVSTEILQRKTPSQRAVVIEHFIQIANHCYKHNDLHCALNITIALGSACIKALRQTWNEVDRKYRQRFEKLKDSMDYHGRCKKMRENLELLTQDSLNKNGKLPAALPYIGAYLDVIYTLEISSKTYNENGLVNFAKMTKLADMVTKALQFQNVGFNFEPRLEIMAYITASKRLSENELYELSMNVEPPSS